MFRLISIELIGHKVLGDLSLDLTPLDDINEKQEFPRTSLIIGINGTGKSRLLRTIAEIFSNVAKKIPKNEEVNLPYAYRIRYSIDSDIYDLYNNRFINLTNSTANKMKTINQVHFLKNRPIEASLFNDDFGLAPNVLYRVEFNNSIMPKRVLASTLQLNDRFPFSKESNDNTFYHYLGARSTPRSISTKGFERNTASFIYEAYETNEFQARLMIVLEHLGYAKQLKIRYRTSYNQRFFHPDVTVDEFHNFFAGWERFRKSEPWGTWKYNYLKEQDPGRFEVLVGFIKLMLNDQLIFQNREYSKSKNLVIDLFRENSIDWDFTIIRDMDQLDLINLDSIELQNEGGDLPLSETSAGEYQMIMSFLGIFAKIRHSSLILIDEPEISLHPNWQMSYINLLNEIFNEYSSCHFIISTHSHFLVSDLRSQHSNINILRKEQRNIAASRLDENTYGWSAEQVLLEVFNVPTTRNLFIADKIGEILELISSQNRDENLISEKVNSLLDKNVLSLKSSDPLATVWSKLVEKYGKGLE